MTLKDGKASLLDEDGAALVMHTKRTIIVRIPREQAGDRLACGVIQQQ